MPTQLKPCPYCGCPDIMLVELKKFCTQVDETYCICPRCGMRGPYKGIAATSADAWNALPRRLKWTKEKPTVEGFYWFKPIVEGKDGVVTVFYYTPGSEVAGELIGDDDGVFAGPIPEPTD